MSTIIFAFKLYLGYMVGAILAGIAVLSLLAVLLALAQKKPRVKK